MHRDSNGARKQADDKEDMDVEVEEPLIMVSPHH
jgi:hypothetical protein